MSGITKNGIQLMIRSTVSMAVLVLLPGVGGAAQEVPESRFFDSSGVRIRYVVEGAGEPVLLIHGFSGDLTANWVAPGLFARLRDAGYRVVAYDSRGHGESGKPHDPALYGPAEVDDAIRLLDHLAITRAHVVGYSRGASIANRLRDEHPDRVRTVVLGGYADSGRGTSPRDSASTEEIAKELEEGNLLPLARWILPDIGPEQVEALAGPLVARNDLRALASAFRADDSFSPLTKLEANEVPALILVGSEDPFLAEARRMEEVMAHLEVVVIPGAGHTSTVARPEFFTALVGFLGRHAVGSSPPRPDEL